MNSSIGISVRKGARKILANLIDDIYNVDTQEITYPCVDGSMFTLEIPKYYGIDAINIAKRSIDFQKAYNIDMNEWAQPGHACLITSTRFGDDFHLFCLTTGVRKATLIVISRDDFNGLKFLDIPHLAAIRPKQVFEEETNVVSFPNGYQQVK